MSFDSEAHRSRYVEGIERTLRRAKGTRERLREQAMENTSNIDIGQWFSIGADTIKIMEDQIISLRKIAGLAK